MSADVVDIGAPLARHDSAVDVEPQSPVQRDKPRRVSHSAPGVRNINELEEEGTELKIAIETQKTGWKINTSPSKIEDTSILAIPLTEPPVKRIDLHFPLGLEVTARNLKGVTIKDALDAIHKRFRKKADDELEKPYLTGFEWDKEEDWTRLIVHLQSEAGPQVSKKKKKKEAKEEKAAEAAAA